MPDDWRASLSFTDRLGAISNITAAYKKANSEWTSAEASKQAKAAEDAAKKNALSIREYHEICDKQIQLLMNSLATEPTEDHHANDHIFPNLPTTGAKIGRYIHAQHYKDGITSEVFLAADPDTSSSDNKQKLVALKITTPDLMVAPHDSKREARILAIAEGKNVIPLIETFQQAGGHFVLVFPFMPHGLDTLLHTNALTPLSRKTVLRDLFTGLAHLHSLDIIHRDIKPSNILLASSSGPAYLADFGIAWHATDSASEPADEKILDVGTTCYRPPELLFGGQKYGTKLDIWAAGCVAAQVVGLGGETLFDAGDLGSELALIKSVFETLGTPDLDVWPEAATLSDWGKMNFAKYPARAWGDILPKAEKEAVDLVSNLVVFESGLRLDAKKALHHSYLA